MYKENAKSRVKRLVADIFGNKAMFSLTNGWVKSAYFPFVRAVGYHDTPMKFAANFRAHLEWYSENFVNCDQAMLDRFLRDGSWPYDKPGLIISFDDGLRSNATIAAPLLEEFGFTGWFMVPAIVPSTEIGTDRQFADTALIPFTEEGLENRLFMSWDDIRSLLGCGHEICCHSLNHTRLGDTLTVSEFDDEIRESKVIMERELGCTIDSFAWVGGESYSFSKEAFEKMQESKYRRIFSTNCFPILPRQTALCLERNHVDAGFRINDVRFSIGGIYDLFYQRKRKRIRHLTDQKSAFILK